MSVAVVELGEGGRFEVTQDLMYGEGKESKGILGGGQAGGVLNAGILSRWARDEVELVGSGFIAFRHTTGRGR